MLLFTLGKEHIFPPVNLAQPDGLLAIGGDLDTDRLLLAYRLGIFPWYSEEPVLWWCPDPRFVLFPAELKISTSMKKVLRRNKFEFTLNKNFAEVIHQCKTIARAEQDGTWITDEMENAFIKLHHAGYAYSAEAWKDGKLAGGMYGLKLGRIFFGESMFSLVSNASKFAFIKFVEWMKEKDIRLLDCQVHTQHLESLGARMITREAFTQKLKQLI